MRSSSTAVVLMLLVGHASGLQLGAARSAVSRVRSAPAAPRAHAAVITMQAPAEEAPRRGLWGGDKEPPVCC